MKTTFIYSNACPRWQTSTPENSCLVGTLKLVRRLSYYVIRYYLLSFLMVAVSAVGVWLPVNAWPSRIIITVVPLLAVVAQALTVDNSVGVNYVMSIHWWYMWLEGFIFLMIAEYAFAIAWAHFITDKKTFHKKLELAQANDQLVDENGEPIPLVLKGYYFGNQGWYRWMGRMVDYWLYFWFGHVDFQKDPYTRNKVDYFCRTVWVIGLIMFVFLYSCITTIYWSASFTEVIP